MKSKIEVFKNLKNKNEEVGFYNLPTYIELFLQSKLLDENDLLDQNLRIQSLFEILNNDTPLLLYKNIHEDNNIYNLMTKTHHSISFANLNLPVTNYAFYYWNINKNELKIQGISGVDETPRNYLWIYTWFLINKNKNHVLNKFIKNQLLLPSRNMQLKDFEITIMFELLLYQLDIQIDLYNLINVENFIAYILHNHQQFHFSLNHKQYSQLINNNKITNYFEKLCKKNLEIYKPENFNSTSYTNYFIENVRVIE